jgi:hypothetical protein
MATKKSAKKGSDLATAVEIGAGVLAAVAAAGATGYYFYGTKNAKKHRQAASAWAKGLKKDVTAQVKKLEKVDAKTVAKVVDQAAMAYAGARGVADADLKVAAQELKHNWEVMKRELAPSAAVKRAAKAATKKGAAKKAATKAVKKAVKTAKKAVKKPAKKRA